MGTAGTAGHAPEPRYARAGGERRVMAKTGMPSDPQQPCGILAADHSGALSLASGILAALFARERTGKGQTDDASIYGTMIAMQGLEINYTGRSRGTSRSAQAVGISFCTEYGVRSAPVTDTSASRVWMRNAGRRSAARSAGIENLEKDPEYSPTT